MANSYPSDYRGAAFQLPNEADRVPTDAYGIYAFRLSLPNDARLGLAAATVDLAAMRSSLRARAERLRRALSDAALAGQVMTAQSPHIRFAYSVAAVPLDAKVHDTFLEGMIEELGSDLPALKAAAAVLRYGLELSSPLYVGMTSKQNFRTRLEQHMSGGTSFSERIRALQVSWSDLQFIIKPLPLSSKAVLTAEKVVQSLLRPRVSLS